MKVTKDAIKIGVGNYIDGELRPILKGNKGLLLRIGIGVGIDALINKYIDNPALEIIGIKTEDGRYEIDKLYEVTKAEISKDGKVSVYGLDFNSNDVDKLYNYITWASGDTSDTIGTTIRRN